MRGKTPFCMDQYSHIFTCCRIPRRGVDELRQFNASNHIIAMVRGSIFKIPVVDENGAAISGSVLERYLL